MAEAAVAGRGQGKQVVGALGVEKKLNSGYPVLSQSATISEGSDGTGAAGVYTATLSLPAGAQILDVQVLGLAVWTAGTTASLIVGDAVDDNGWYLATDLKATDLLADEALTFEHPGGLAGAFIGSEKRIFYNAGAVDVIAEVTTVGTVATVGRTRIVVFYSIPADIEATYVAT